MPDSAPQPKPQPPPVTGPETGPAKPSAPGAKDPPGIAESILPERKRDASRHPPVQGAPAEAVQKSADVAAAEEAAAETGRPASQSDDD